MVRRSAFTLIEVILALVIIGITVLTVPMIIQVNTASTQGSLNQEGIFAASAKLLQTLSFPWDENANNAELAAEGADVLAGVVKVTANANTSPTFDVTNANNRPGLISRQTRRDGFGIAVDVSNIGNDNPSLLVRGIDDFNGQASNVANDKGLAGAVVVDAAAGYKANYTMTTAVNYIDDQINSAGGTINYNTPNPLVANTFVLSNTPVAGPTNLRMVSISIFGRDDDNDGNPDLISVLNAYAANIGETKPYKRRY
ncbi:MAG: prepilin-type N-terminal cleavage/methylation domain-containing protein [Sulfuricurvum sp.]|uniref:type II secretion system protein n=1 Tax=Sulfuricurvum sp. TaxID=2025608 RepID=UPI002608DD6A|nr:prepilin-type N-terminal cleavage/methylation domain-containing protein [Sulfuricurvum sp.]MDD5158922.1 prepilin-type N-terminal cleavage/methylation domain-containing protein [Sulfuricurvum sp.]